MNKKDKFMSSIIDGFEEFKRAYRDFHGTRFYDSEMERYSYPTFRIKTKNRRYRVVIRGREIFYWGKLVFGGVTNSTLDTDHAHDIIQVSEELKKKARRITDKLEERRKAERLQKGKEEEFFNTFVAD